MDWGNLSFKRIPDSGDNSYEKSYDPDKKKISSFKADGDKSPRISFKKIIEPKRVQELFEFEKFAELLGGSLVFIHNRKRSSYLLIDEGLNRSMESI